MSTPHDALVQWTFSQLDYARSELAVLLPPSLVEKLDFASLAVESGTFVDQQLALSYSDLLYSVNLAGQPAFVYLLFEHQSTVEALMPLRLLKYMVRIWDRYCDDRPKAEHLPPIVPLVLHHSSSGWTQSTSFHDLIAPPLTELPEIAELVPSFRFLLDDLSRQSTEDLLGRPQPAGVLAVLWALRDARNGPRMLDGFPAFGPALVGMSAGPGGLQAMIRWLSYITDVVEAPTSHEIQRRVIETVGAVAEKAMATIAEQLRQEGRQQGRQQGRQEGRQEGQRGVVLKQLRVRFGEVPDRVVARVDAATSEQLDRWAERILTAKSIDEVLDG